jgi:hypothetical protein
MPFMLILRAQRYYISFFNLKFKMYRFEAQYFVFQDDLSLFVYLFLFRKKTRKKDAALTIRAIYILFQEHENIK